MRNNQLSKEENILFELIQTVDAMTYDQIQQFLTKFLGCSENVPKYIIHNLIRMRAIEATQEDEEGYITCGNSGFQTNANINTDVIYALYYLLDKAKTLDEVLSLVPSNMNNVALSFILNGEYYEATYVSLDEISNIYGEEQEDYWKTIETNLLKAIMVYIATNEEGIPKTLTSVYKTVNEKSGIDETSLSQSVFVQIQSGIQLLSDDEKKQLETAEIEAEGNRLTLVNVASSLIGSVPYQWGGKSSKSGYDTSWYTFENGQQKGLDCSGYIQWVFRTAGYSEDIWKQLTSTSTIMQTCEQIPQSDLQIGDLGILNNGETINHVGMYIGNGYYIHCNAGDKTVSISKPEFTLFYRVAETDSEILSPQADGDVASSITYTDEELYLIAQTVWHEARGEGSNGWIAVAEVIKNRVLNPLYPETVQDVIYQTGQFSYNEQIVNMIPNETEIEVVKMVLDGKVSILGDDNVLWFKNPTITDDDEADIDSTSEISDWNGHKPYKLIGSHMFYK